MFNEIRKSLKKWYIENGRDLPWRKSLNPYNIWLSEIILQQTQINQGLPYYYAFIEKYPDIFALANADEQDVLNLWQGLGYYSRARNMLQTAKIIVNEYQGQFPDEYSSLIKLKGVGKYTASAIISIAFNKAFAVVDGNVYRLLSRLFGIDVPVDTASGQKVFTKLADELLDKNEPGNFNQAMMDFGALQCKKVPNCSICPLQNYCTAFMSDTVSDLPVKSKKTVVKNRYMHYLLLEKNQQLILTKRTSDDIWKNLYDFPLIETLNSSEIGIENIKHLIEPHNLAEEMKCIYKVNHKLTHRNITANFYVVNLKKPLKKINFEREYVFVNKNRIEDFPFPKLIENFFKFYLH